VEELKKEGGVFESVVKGFPVGKADGIVCGSEGVGDDVCLIVLSELVLPVLGVDLPKGVDILLAISQ